MAKVGSYNDAFREEFSSSKAEGGQTKIDESVL